MDELQYWIVLDFTGTPNKGATECMWELDICSLVFNFIIVKQI